MDPFQILIDRHGRAVHRFLSATVGVLDADDCYQETFLAALRAYPQLDELTNPRGWLLTIAHHKAIDQLRARGRRAVPVAEVESVAAATDPPPSDPDPIWARVAALPDKQRTAVALRFLADLTHAEIGQTMQISEAAARRNVHEGITRLRREHDR